MVELPKVPDPERTPGSKTSQPRWVSFQIAPVTSQPVNQRHIPAGLLSPNYQDRKATAANTNDPGNLISTILMDPVQVVRKTAAIRLADLYSLGGYLPGFSLRLATVCGALAKSKDPAHTELAGMLAKEVTQRTITDSSPAAAFGTLVMAIFYADAVSRESRTAARTRLAADQGLSKLLNLIAQKSVSLDSERPANDDVYVGASEIDYNSRQLLDLDPACAVIACLSRNESIAEKGAGILASLCQAENRSQFPLRMLAFLATPVSLTNTNLTFSHFQFDPTDIANLSPWLVIRFGSRPEASSPRDELSRCAEYSGTEWARISAPLLEKLDQYCATGSATAIIGAARLLRTFSLPDSDSEIASQSLNVAFAQLAALKNLRIAAKLSDGILAHEITAQIRYISKNITATYQSNPDQLQTINELASLGTFDPMALISIARVLGGEPAATTIISNLINQVLLINVNESLSVRARSLMSQEHLAQISDGATRPIRSLKQNFGLSGDLVSIFSNLLSVLACTSNHDEYGIIRDKFVGALQHTSQNILPAHRKHFHQLIFKNISERVTAPDSRPCAPILKLLFELLDSPPSPDSLVTSSNDRTRFDALGSEQLVRLFRAISQNLPVTTASTVQTDFDLTEIMVESLTAVSHFILSAHWGAEKAELTREDLGIAITACRALQDDPRYSIRVKTKIARLLAILEGN